MDTSFIDLTKEANLKRMNIDPRIIVPFKSVMYSLQEAFNRKGYTQKINYKELFESYALGKEPYDEEKLKESEEFENYYQYIVERSKRICRSMNKEFKEFSKESQFEAFLRDSGILTIEVISSESEEPFMYYFDNKIIIDERILTRSDLEQQLSHEFIHFITLSGKMPVSVYCKDFYIESVTEMINREAYPEATGYSILGKLIEYSMLILKIKDHTSFLKKELDPRYTDEWKEFFIKANDFYLNKRYRGIDIIKDIKQEDLKDIIELQRIILNIIANHIDFSDENSYLNAVDLILQTPYIDYDKEYIQDFINCLNNMRDDRKTSMKV